jgi:hypothetical protein
MRARLPYEVAPDLSVLVGDRTVIVGCPLDDADYDGTVSVEVYEGGQCLVSRMCWYREGALVEDISDVIGLIGGVA